jgi:DnaJ-class molecular chaperone
MRTGYTHVGMGFVNHYQTLELPNFAEVSEVKAAYRKLARRFHPDLHGGDATLEERFKAINDAYDALGDADKKRFFDLLLRRHLSPYRTDGTTDSGKPRPGSTWGVPPQDTAPHPAYDESAASSKPENAGSKHGVEADTTAKHYKGKGEDITVETWITEAEATVGVVKAISVQHRDRCRRCAGSGRINGLPCAPCHGEGKLTRVKKLDIRIPPGVKTGSRVRVKNEGSRSTQAGGGESGDLYLLIRVIASHTFDIDGLDVSSELPVSILDAVLGCETEVATLHGPVRMTIPPLTSSGRVFRLREQGVHAQGQKGDHFVTVQLQVPTRLSTEEKRLYETLAQLAQTSATAKSQPG